ncbi:helix-turn-helix domain-containing protein [Glaciimonas sp. GG7]
MNIGERLKEERERLGMNQTNFAALAGVGRKTQFSYEHCARTPDANYLAAVAKAGADVGYIITGTRHLLNLFHPPERLCNAPERLGSNQSDSALYGDPRERERILYHIRGQEEDADYSTGIVIDSDQPPYIVDELNTAADIVQDTVIDWNLLMQVIGGIERFLRDRKMVAGPKKRAALILIAYARFVEDTKIDPVRFNAFMEAVMATL